MNVRKFYCVIPVATLSIALSQKLDRIDAKLLSDLLRENSLKKIDVTRQTIASKISKLEKEIIDGFRAKIDYSKLGYNSFFVLFLKLEEV